MPEDVLAAIVRDLADTMPFFEGLCIYCDIPEARLGKVNRQTRTRAPSIEATRDDHAESCVWRRALDACDAMSGAV